MKKPMPTGDYYALVARAQRRPNCDVYAWSIRQPLPTIPIPLKVRDADVSLNLVNAFALAYERGRYARTIDYSRPLDLPLQPKDRVWAKQIATKAIERTSS
jgi:hypothetical protein